MKNVNRIAIIGNAGSGKSVLAKELHEVLNLPVYHLDQYFWKPNWTHPDIEEYKIVHDKICDQDKWIIDGMNLKLLEYRIDKADVIIFLDMPRYKCFWRIFKRTFKYYGKEAPSSAKDCPEGFSWKFVKFLKWVWDFKKRYPRQITLLLSDYANAKEVYVLRSQKDIDLFIKNLDKN